MLKKSYFQPLKNLHYDRQLVKLKNGRLFDVFISFDWADQEKFKCCITDEPLYGQCSFIDIYEIGSRLEILIPMKYLRGLMVPKEIFYPKNIVVFQPDVVVKKEDVKEDAIWNEILAQLSKQRLMAMIKQEIFLFCKNMEKQWEIQRKSGGFTHQSITSKKNTWKK